MFHWRPTSVPFTSISLVKKACQYLHADANLQEHVMRVAVIGDPNVGKSTLINEILGRRVNSVSKKVHTTRRKTLAVLNHENTQIVFVDTPGFVSRRSKTRKQLEKSVLFDAYDSVEDVDVVITVHDSGNFYTKYKFSEEVKRALDSVPPNTKSVLALNKTDLVKSKSELLTMTQVLARAPVKQVKSRGIMSMNELFDVHERKVKEAESLLRMEDQDETHPAREDGKTAQQKTTPDFDDVFMISALDGTGIRQLKEYLIENAKPASWLHTGGFYTDQSADEMITICIREKLLDNLPDEIPYLIKPVVNLMHQDESGILNIIVTLNCHNNRQKGQLLGPNSELFRKITAQTEFSLCEAFNQTVLLDLSVKMISRKGKGDVCYN